jgi:phosphopantothenoylcysteine decarboxylase/phosphopantothenate--cysteine ligase
MNDNMYKNSVTQENLERLKKRNFTIVEPEYGRLASGKIGTGRLADIRELIDAVEQALEQRR